MTNGNKKVNPPNIFELPLDSEELITLGYAFSVEKIMLLKQAGIPILWQPLGAVRTLKCRHEEALDVLKPKARPG